MSSRERKTNNLTRHVLVTPAERDEVINLIESRVHAMDYGRQEHLLSECNYMRDLVRERNPDDGDMIAAIINGMFAMTLLDILNEMDKKRVREVG